MVSRVRLDHLVALAHLVSLVTVVYQASMEAPGHVVPLVSQVPLVHLVSPVCNNFYFILYFMIK